MLIRKRIFFLVLCISFFACRKDNNVDYPSVQITSPTGLVTYNVFDTIQITAHASDADGLQSVNVYLATPSGTPVLQNIPVKITSNNMTFNVSYILGDIHLASGNYEITVSASNGTHTTNAYEEIYVNAAPTKLVAIYAFIRSGTSVQVYTMDSMLHSSLAFSEPCNFSSSDVSSYYQQLYIAANDTGNMYAVSVPGGGSSWGINGVYSVAPYFTNVYSYGDAAYLSFYNNTNGYINYYNHSGVMQIQFPSAPDYSPVRAYNWSNYLFAEEKDNSSPAEYLELFYLSGVGYQQTSLSGPLVAMCGQDNDHIFVFGNQTSGTPYMLQYSISNNLFYSPISLPSAKLLSATEINSNTYLVGFANNTIYQYTYNPNNLLPYISGVNANRIRYDVANNTVVAAVGKSVNEYNYTTGALMYSAPLPDSVMDVQILYNK